MKMKPNLATAEQVAELHRLISIMGMDNVGVQYMLAGMPLEDISAKRIQQCIDSLRLTVSLNADQLSEARDWTNKMI